MTKCKQIKILPTNKDLGIEPYILSISNPKAVTAYMKRKDHLFINYEGNIYQIVDITEEQLLNTFKHLKK